MGKKSKLSAVEWIDLRYKERMGEQNYKEMIEVNTPTILENFINDTHTIYEEATWIDANIKGGCIVDPFFMFHFYEEEDAVAFKLRWE